jgi:site-specific recombinase XerD
VPLDATLTDFFAVYPRRPETELIFASSSGSRLKDIRGGFLNACSRAGIIDLHFHDLRHCFSSFFVASGGDLYVLKEILGHKLIQMTQRYAHLSPAYKVKAIDRMNNLWQSAEPASTAPKTPSQPVPVTPASQPPSPDNPAPAQIL